MGTSIRNLPRKKSKAKTQKKNSSEEGKFSCFAQRAEERLLCSTLGEARTLRDVMKVVASSRTSLDRYTHGHQELIILYAPGEERKRIARRSMPKASRGIKEE